MKIASAFLTAIGPVMLLAGCTAAPLPVVRQSLALPAGPRSIALSPPPPDAAAAAVPGDAAIRAALRGAGYTPLPTARDARFLLTLTTALAPRRLGSLVPAEKADAAAPPDWIARPQGGLHLGGSGRTLRVTAVLIDPASGREYWRGAIAAPSRGRATDLDALAARLLAALPRG